jgi:hypothetical protein
LHTECMRAHGVHDACANSAVYTGARLGPLCKPQRSCTQEWRPHNAGCDDLHYARRVHARAVCASACRVHARTPCARTHAVCTQACRVHAHTHAMCTRARHVVVATCAPRRRRWMDAHTHAVCTQANPEFRALLPVTVTLQPSHPTPCGHNLAVPPPPLAIPAAAATASVFSQP